jgi:hypothetical protein
VKVFLSVFAAIALASVIAFTAFEIGKKENATIAPTASPSPLPTSTATPKPSATVEPIATFESPRDPLEAESKEPSYTWVRKGQVGIVLNTLSRTINALHVETGDKIRLTVKSQSAVTFSVASADSTSQLGFDPSTQTCSAYLVFDVTVECEAPENAVLIIGDGRKIGTAVAALALRGMTGQNAIAQNKVAISLFRYECVTWCTP